MASRPRLKLAARAEKRRFHLINSVATIMANDIVILSEVLQRNARHEARLSKISGPFCS
jgi:hypothetical protein